MPNIIELADYNAPELDIYSRLNEPQLFHYFEPEPGIFIAETPMIIERAMQAGYKPLSLLVEQKQLSSHRELLSQFENVPIYTAPLETLVKLTGFHLTRGFLCAMIRRNMPALSEVCKNARRIAILEHVMNPTNVGAIFRSAAALGMDAVLLTPDCSDPLQRRAARVSMGTVFQIPWTYLQAPGAPNWPYPAMEELRDMGFQTVAMALTEDSISIQDPRLQDAPKLAIVLGTEGDGLAQSTIAACDYTVRIPMHHGVDSLNVAAASAVAFWQLSLK